MRGLLADLLQGLFQGLATFSAAHPRAALITGALVAWQFSVRRNPYARCWRCRGVARYFGLLFTRSWHHCPVCDGDGKRIRVGGTSSPRLKREDKARIAEQRRTRR